MISDKGKWSVFYKENGRPEGVISDDFDHDVVLRVSGDFVDKHERLRYCQWLAAKLNGEISS
jgi:hypothetical protein